MVIDRKARRADRAQHRIAQTLAVIEFGAVRGFEQQPAQPDHQHQVAVAQFHHAIVDVVRIREPAARATLTREQRLGLRSPGCGVRAHAFGFQARYELHRQNR
ncbi:MAG: hypothetical protein NVS3B27_08540 [Novosphingobium sp.]